MNTHVYNSWKCWRNRKNWTFENFKIGWQLKRERKKIMVLSKLSKLSFNRNERTFRLVFVASWIAPARLSLTTKKIYDRFSRSSPPFVWWLAPEAHRVYLARRCDTGSSIMAPALLREKQVERPFRDAISFRFENKNPVLFRRSCCDCLQKRCRLVELKDKKKKRRRRERRISRVAKSIESWRWRTKRHDLRILRLVHTSRSTSTSFFLSSKLPIRGTGIVVSRRPCRIS